MRVKFINLRFQQKRFQVSGVRCQDNEADDIRIMRFRLLSSVC